MRCAHCAARHRRSQDRAAIVRHLGCKIWRVEVFLYIEGTWMSAVQYMVEEGGNVVLKSRVERLDAPLPVDVSSSSFLSHAQCAFDVPSRKIPKIYPPRTYWCHLLNVVLKIKDRKRKTSTRYD